jgi:hypothetical protein
MILKQYFPISLALFIGVVSAAVYFSVPILPFALILLAGETLLGFQLEDRKVPRFLAEMFRAPRSHAH